MNVEPSSKRLWLLRAAKVLILAIVVWAVHRTLYQAWQQVGQYEWQLEPVWLAAAAGLYLTGLTVAGLFWRRVLQTMGQEAGIVEALRAYFIGHLGKYVPGKAMVVVLRAGLIRGSRVNTAVAAASVFFETLTMMAVGAFLAAAVLAAGFREDSPLFVAALGMMALSGLPIVPPVFRRLARLAGVGKSDPAIRATLDRLGYGILALGVVAMTISWGFLGLSLWATLRAMGLEGLDPWGELPRYTACVSLAMVAGFVLLVLPGGLGVREAVLIELLVPYLVRLFSDSAGPRARAALIAVAAAALLRLVWLLSEILAAALVYLWRPRRQDHAETGLPAQADPDPAHEAIPSR